MQVSQSASHVRPVPLGGLVAQEGGSTQEDRHEPASLRFFLQNSHQPQNFSGNFLFRPEKSGRTNFRPEIFWIFQISNRKKSGRRNFSPNFFSFFNFQPENFLVFQLSRPKKVRVFLIPVPGPYCWIYAGEVS
ncbi:hypothetical protein [Methanoregula sp. UBA64]|uniref:hypothetical protein n=1 Tax=Methanoregula sp. UBA64 TaxID=1915554 RepID=UPI0025CEB7E1|nr:hypothetical protein [Methanoregula sp. UBA64]